MRRVVERLLLNLQLERLRSAALRSTSRAASATCCPRPAHPPSTTQSRRSPGAASSMSCSMWPPSLPWRVVTTCPRTSRIVYSGNTTSDAAASPRITQAVFETPTNPTSIYSTYIGARLSTANKVESRRRRVPATASGAEGTRAMPAGSTPAMAWETPAGGPHAWPSLSPRAPGARQSLEQTSAKKWGWGCGAGHAHGAPDEVPELGVMPRGCDRSAAAPPLREASTVPWTSYGRFLARLRLRLASCC